MRSPILRAIQTTLRQEFDVEINEHRLVVEVRPEGKPSPKNAMFSVIIHTNNWTTPEGVPDNSTTAYEIGIAITVTQRTSEIPYERLEELYLPEELTLSIDQVLARVIRRVGLPNGYALLAIANADSELTYGEFQETPLGQYYEPPRFITASPEPIPVTAEWFQNDPESFETEVVGVRQTAQFGGCKFAMIDRCDTWRGP